jgi:hypothetical protein
MRGRVGVGLAAAVVFLFGILAVVLSSGDDAGDEVTAARSAPITTTTTVAPAAEGDRAPSNGEPAAPAGEDPAVEVHDDPVPAGAPAAGEQTPSAATDERSAGGDGAASAAVAAADVRAPAPGSYTYRFEAESDDGPSEREAEAVVEDLGPRGEAARRAVTIEAEQGTIRNELTWGAERVLLERTTMQFGPQEIDCRWEPAIEQMRLPLGPGQRWESRSKCSTTAFGQPAELTRRAITRVTGQERIEVGGRSVDVWVLASRERTTAKGGTPAQPFDVVWETEATTWFAPGAGMIARQHSESTFTMNGGEPREASTRMELLSLDPA